jgi:hypothetical protein
MFTNEISKSTYHRLLRVLALVFAVVLIFDSGLITDSTSQVSDNAQLYLATAVGMTAKVEPTELNLYTASLTQKEMELDAREASLAEREISVNISAGGQTADVSTYILSSILFILLLLILLNYALDYFRAREIELRSTV